MSIFDEFLPWTMERINQINSADLSTYFSEARNITQDQEIPISNLMVLLYQKIHGELDTSHFLARYKLVQWYQSIGQYTYKINELTLLLEQKPRTLNTTKVKGINIIGYARSISGLGEDVRAFIHICRELNIPHSIYCLGHFADSANYKNIENEADSTDYSVSVFCVNGFEFAKILNMTKNIKEKYGYIVLQSPWELPKIPDPWRQAIEVVDEIWSISRFVHQAYVDSGCAQVRYFPPLIDKAKVTNNLTNGIQKRPFTLLYIFDAASYIDRKNPFAAIEAFQKAFVNQEEVCLFLKTINLERSEVHAELTRVANADKRIIVDNSSYSQNEVVTLIHSCDCYISLHRSEGFGRTIAQAALQKKPIISTYWSGSTDILCESNPLNISFGFKDISENDYPYGLGQQWAEPNLDDVIQKLKIVFKYTDAQRDSLGKSNFEYVYQRFSLEHNKNVYREILNDVLSKSEIR